MDNNFMSLRMDPGQSTHWLVYLVGVYALMPIYVHLVHGMRSHALRWVAVVLALGTLFLVSNVALQYGASRLPSNVTSVVMLTEVLFASATAVWFGGGVVSPQLLGGGACIVAAALLAAFRSARSR